MTRGFSTLKTDIRDGFFGLLQLLLPQACVGCSDPGNALCERCLQTLNQEQSVKLSALPQSSVITLARARYEGTLRQALIAYKTRGLRVLARPLSRVFLSALHEVQHAAVRNATNSKSDTTDSKSSATDLENSANLEHSAKDLLWVIPPLSKKSLQERGFHQVMLLLRRAGIPRQRIILANYVTQPSDQTVMSQTERENNVANSMHITKDLTRYDLVLVDDIVTTGATIRELYRCTREVGGNVVGAVFLATVPKYADR